MSPRPASRAPGVAPARTGARASPSAPPGAWRRSRWHAAVPASAVAATPGVVLNDPYGLVPQIGGYVGSVGVPWVRSFVAWNSDEPTRGQLSPAVVGTLEQGLAALPPGTHTVLDVLDSPEWASGSSNPATPPRNPADYGAFVGKLAKRLGSRVAAWEIWNEEDARSSGPPAPTRPATPRCCAPHTRRSSMQTHRRRCSSAASPETTTNSSNSSIRREPRA